MDIEILNKYRYVLLFSIIIALGLVSFTLCLAAEFKKSKIDDLVLEGKLCYLPGSAAFELGIMALICLSVTQLLGNLFVCRKFSSRKHRKPTLSCILLVFSWISFGVAVILISAATSMSQSQHLGQGWLDGECYLVKDGVYVGSAILILLVLGFTLGSGAITARQKQVEENNGGSCTSRRTNKYSNIQEGEFSSPLALTTSTTQIDM